MDKFNDILGKLKVYFNRAKDSAAAVIKNLTRGGAGKNGRVERIPRNGTRLPVVIISAAAMLALAALVVWAAFFRPVNVTITLPKQAVYAAECLKTASYSDIFASSSDITVSGTDVSGTDISLSRADKESALFAYYLFLPVSGTDQSPSDTSGSDVSAADVPEKEDDNITVSLKLSRKATVADALRAVGIPDSEYLFISRPLDEIVKKDMNILLSLLVRVRVTVDGVTFETMTGSKTVGEVLSDSDISLGVYDRISEQLSAELRQDMNIVINRVEIREEKRTEVIPFETVQKNNGDMLKGETKVVTEGKNGEKSLTFRMTFVDGEFESEEKIAEEVTIVPVDEVVEIGTKTTTTVTSKTAAKTKKTGSGRYVVSKEKVYDCDGSGHGYYIITYSDGTVEYQDF